MKHEIILATVAICLFSCGPVVTFQEPQPAGKDDISEFPGRLRGRYVSTEDSSTLDITEHVILRACHFNYKLHPNQLDSNQKIQGDTIFDAEKNLKYPVKRVGDSLIAHIHYMDTLFQINEHHVLRKMKGYYFMSKHRETGNWEVKKMSLSKGKLVISEISAPDDIEYLKEVTESPEDTMSNNFRISKKEFREFVVRNGFSERETFIRMKKSPDLK